MGTYLLQPRGKDLLITPSIHSYFDLSLAQHYQRLRKKQLNQKIVIIIGYILSASITCYLHYFGLLLVSLQGVAALIYALYYKILRLSLIITYTFILLAYLPWMPALWNHINNKRLDWILPPDYTAIINYLKFCFNDSIVVLLCIIPFYFIYLLTSIKKISSTVDLKKNLSLLNPTFLVLLWLIVPFSIAYIKSIISAPVLTNRNLIISLPAVYLLLARSTTKLYLKSKYKYCITFGIIALLIVHLIFIKQYYTTPQKEQFREAVNYIINSENIPEDESVVVGYAWNRKYFDYYFSKNQSTRTIDILAGKKRDIPWISKFIDIKAPKYIWLITAHKIPEKEFINFLRSRFTLIEYKRFKKARVWLFMNSNLENKPKG